MVGVSGRPDGADMSWDTPLARPLKPKDHAELRTLEDARKYAVALPDHVAARRAWQHAAQLLLEAAEDPTDAAIAAATDQVNLALFLTYREDMTDAPRR